MADYSNAFKIETTNLSTHEHLSRVFVPTNRNKEIDEITQLLRDKRSVLICGESGVGKTSILQGVASRLFKVKWQLRELNSGTLMAGTRYLGDWQSKAREIFDAAIKANAVIYFTDIWNLPTVGVSSGDPSGLLDFVRDDLRSGKLQIVGEVVPEILQEMEKTPGFVDLFTLVRVEPLTAQAFNEAIKQHAQRLALKVSDEHIKHLIRLTENFKARQAGPGAVIDLMQQVKDYQRLHTKGDKTVSIDFIDQVFSEYSGLPLFIISPSHTKPVADIRRWFRERIIGQQQAVEAVIESIALFKSGIRDPRQPVGSFLFVGPTGVGKTELAKALATFLFGSEQRLLRFDMSEYKDYHSFNLLLGNPDYSSSPARLLDPVRSQPFQIILFDEIEKAHPNIWDLLLQLLDEGRLSPPSGQTVNFRSTIIICTSNAGAQTVQQQPIGFHADKDSSGKDDPSPQISMSALEQFFRPEILNRFQHIVTFHPLNHEHMGKIARAEIKRILQRDGIIERNLVVDLDEDVINAVILAGFDSRYGARALKRSVQRIIALPIAYFLMEQKVTSGSLLMLGHSNGRTLLRTAKTETSIRQQNLEREQQANAQNKVKLETLRAAQKHLKSKITDLETAVGKADLEARLEYLDGEKQSNTFWDHSQQAMRVILEIEKTTGNLQRLDDLNYALVELWTLLNGSLSVQSLNKAAAGQARLKDRIAQCRRELVMLGDDGDQDALMVLAPIGHSAKARDFVFALVTEWATARGRKWQLLSEPLTENDEAMVLIKGPYAFGYLLQEAGLHRLRFEDNSSTVRVMVAPWTGEEMDVTFVEQSALKQSGCYGGKIRSSVQFEHSGFLTVSNRQNLNENRELARRIAHAMQSSQDSDEVIRRYDEQPFAVKDYKTSYSTNRKDDLRGEGFQRLLERRVDASSSN